MNELVITAVIVGLLLLAAKLAEEAMERLGFPGFLGAILAGVTLGKAGLGIVDSSDVESAAILFFIGINFTLFLAGIEELANPALLMPRWKELGFGIAYLVFPAIVLAIPLTLKGLDIQASIALAIVLAMVSVGPLIKILMSRGRLGPKELSILRTALVTELTGLTLFNTLAQGFNYVRLLESAVFVLLVVYVGRRYLDEILLAVERYIAVREAPFAIVVAIVLTASYLAEILGFNAAVTALMFGAFLSEYMLQRPLCLERIRAFTYGFLEPLFFIGLGLQASPLSIADIGEVFLFTALLASTKILMSIAQGLKGRESIVMLAKGGVDAALLSTMLEAKTISSSLYTVSLMAVILSAILASSAYRLKSRAIEPLRLKLAELPLDNDVVSEDTPADIAADLVAKKGAVVVIDKNMHPVGYVAAEDLVGISTELLKVLPVRLLLRMEVPIVGSNKTVSELLSDPSLMHEPIIAVVDDKGRVIGTLSPRKLLALLLHPKQERHKREG